MNGIIYRKWIKNNWMLWTYQDNAQVSISADRYETMTHAERRAVITLP